MILDAFRLDGKDALITGSRTGLGKAIALGLAEAGANVIVHGSRADGLEEVCAAARASGVKAAGIVADLADPEAPGRLFAAALEQFGSIDILINNAGILRRSPAADYPMKDWNEVLQIDLTAVFRLAQLAGKHMIARGAGKIVNIASALSFQGGILVPAYAAAKGGVAQLTKALANEWAAKGVNVNGIAPGYMETEVTSALRADPVRSRQILERIPAGRWGSPVDLAGAAVFLSSSASDYIHGTLLIVDGGWLSR
ncbi:MAG TPA: SDR family oxidoreductase [Bryobacteraceae bacterium]|jgi:2-dehydro-3-deoxy-D-gluconate 5-dehydrogenase|nr:SDR family oxidoreductase [Bryobacteraceae bacterium]